MLLRHSLWLLKLLCLLLKFWQWHYDEQMFIIRIWWWTDQHPLMNNYFYYALEFTCISGQVNMTYLEITHILCMKNEDFNHLTWNGKVVKFLFCIRLTHLWLYKGSAGGNILVNIRFQLSALVAHRFWLRCWAAMPSAGTAGDGAPNTANIIKVPTACPTCQAE